MLLDDGCDNVIFLGKGCTAQHETVKGHLAHLEKHMYPLVTCGRILHRDSLWKDFRELGTGRHLNLFNGSGTIIQNPMVFTSGLGISVANFGMNRSAIDRIGRFTRMYFEGHGPFPEMDESFNLGGYGKVLSMCAWCSRVTVFMLPTGILDAVVYDAEGGNPYNTGSDDGTEVIGSLKEKMAKMPLGLDFFDSAQDY